MYDFEDFIEEDPIKKYGCTHDDIVFVDGVEICRECGIPTDILDEEDLSTEELYVLHKLHNTEPDFVDEDEELLWWANAPYRAKFEGEKFAIYVPKTSDVIVYIKKKQFDLLRTLAFNGYLYRNVESCAILYGKNNTITKVKRYDAIQTQALVTSNITDIMKFLTKKNFIGVFHSHLFEGASPSSVDKDSLSGWTAARAPLPVYSLIGCLPHFKMKCWSMDKDFNIQSHILEVI